MPVLRAKPWPSREIWCALKDHKSLTQPRTHSVRANSLAWMLMVKRTWSVVNFNIHIVIDSLCFDFNRCYMPICWGGGGGKSAHKLKWWYVLGHDSQLIKVHTPSVDGYFSKTIALCTLMLAHTRFLLAPNPKLFSSHKSALRTMLPFKSSNKIFFCLWQTVNREGYEPFHVHLYSMSWTTNKCKALNILD